METIQTSENWSWGKFFKGFFDGRNYAKAIVLGVCMVIVLVIVTSVYSTMKHRLFPSKPETAVGTNQGIIATKNEDKSGNSYQLFNLFNWK